MDAKFAWVVLQAISVVILAAVGLLKSTRGSDGGLDRAGWSMLVLGSAIFIATTVMIYVLGKKEQDRSDARIDSLYQEIAKCVMVLRGQFLSPVPVPKPSGELRIDAPKDGDQVESRLYVGGSGAALKDTVWLIVHPLEGGAYWVQPPVTVRMNSTWNVQAYIGRAGGLDIGKQFELLSVANPLVPLSEGQVIDQWPEAGARSNVVRVVRK
jgi:hypothetical protein